jgi:hypothetical protein
VPTSDDAAITYVRATIAELEKFRDPDVPAIYETEG